MAGLLTAAGVAGFRIECFIVAATSGEATNNDGSSEFRTRIACILAPVPGIGAGHRQATKQRWMPDERDDAFPANVNGIDGTVWNITASPDYALPVRVGLPLACQLFELDAKTTGFD